MKQKSFLVAMSLLLFSSLSPAENVWKNSTYIEGVQALHTGGYILYLPPDSSLSCQEGGKLFYLAANQNGMTQEGLSNILSVALVAYTAKRQVSVLYDDSSSSCYVQQVYLKGDG